MCGIAGILIGPNKLSAGLNAERGGRIDDTDCLAGMLKGLEHRGPDDQGSVWCDTPGGKLGLAHTRLSILDLSAAGHQPMRDPETGNWIIFNGEIYNFKEIRTELDLAPDAWASQSDTETILKAYARWGLECLARLRGMFAFAIWDAEAQKLFMARDRLGIKPLYYYAADGLFLFGSEVRALLASNLIPRQLDRAALVEYLTYQTVPAPKTMIRNVSALAPGAWLQVDADGGLKSGEYWHLLHNAARADGVVTYDAARAHVHELLRESINLHLVSDVPVGVFLSGGIDSSALVALVRETGRTAQTFTVAFSEDAYDETVYARQIAKIFATDHTEIRLTENTLLEQLPQALAAMDQPTGDGINTFIVAKAVRESGIKVVLSGLGGDEFFAGYPSFNRLERGLKLSPLWGRLPKPLRHLMASTLSRTGGASIRTAKISASLETDGSLAAMYPIIRQVLSRQQRGLLLNGGNHPFSDGLNDPYTDLLQANYLNAPWADTLAKISYAEARTYMHDVLLRDTDQMSMAHGLEVRVPFIDHKLVEYVMGLPASYKRANGTPKRLLVESLGGLLPKEIVHRPKQGFTLPFAIWMRGAMRQFCEARLERSRLHARGIFDPEQVDKLWQALLQGHPGVSWSRLWVLIALEEWLELNEITS